MFPSALGPLQWFSHVISLCLYLSYITLSVNATDRPIIGVVSVPCSVETQNCAPAQVDFNATSYIPSSYVKWIESGGGRVVPILGDADDAYIENLLSTLNGIVFTGGAAPLDTSSTFYYSQIAKILNYLRKYSKESNQTEAIPLWSTCLGLQALLTTVAKDGTKVRSHTDAENYPTSVNFSQDALTNSQMFSEYGYMEEWHATNVYSKLSQENITMNNHKYGIKPQFLHTDEYLNTNFSLLGTSTDKNNSQFVTLVESKRELGLYWYGSQFHPEKPVYEFDGTNSYRDTIPHSLDAIIVNEYFAQFFVNQCRMQNNNSMTDKEYVKHVIYNYYPYYVNQNKSKFFEQVYVFPNASEVYYDYDYYFDELYENELMADELKLSKRLNKIEQQSWNDNRYNVVVLSIIIIIIVVIWSLFWIYVCKYCNYQNRNNIKAKNMMMETSPLMISIKS